MVIAAAIALTGCEDRSRRVEPAPVGTGPIDPVSVRVGELLAQLRGGDRGERADAIEQIRGLASRRALDTDEGIALVYALPSVPIGEGDEVDAQTAVVAALAEDPRLPYLPAIEQVAGALGPRARTRAIALVGMIDDPTAARFFLRLLAAYPDESPGLAFAHLKAHPQQADALFPELLALAERPTLFYDVLGTALAYCGDGKLRPRALGAHAGPILEAYREARELLLPRQDEEGVAWMTAQSYAEARAGAALLLDLMGCMPLDVVETDLREALDYRDPVLLYYATNSLLTHGVVPPAEVLARIAASDETREWLRAMLADADRPELFPAQ